MEKQAFKIAAVALGILALAMVVYYKKFRAHTEEEISLSQKVESTKEVKSEFEGIYSPTEAIDADGKMVSFLSISKKEEGGFTGTWRAEKIGSNDTGFFECNDVKVLEKEFFVRCANPEFGTISYDGVIQRADNSFTVSGKILWMMDSTPILEKTVQLTHAAGD